jgi:SAM-dependent methyltransferase
MIVAGLVALALLGCFSFVLLYGAPYLPTLDKQVTAALDMADLKPGQTLLELGCGDGKVLVAAAERGCYAVGYELNPILALVAWVRTRRYKGKVKVYCRNFWNVDWPPAEVIFVFLLDRFMLKLDKKIIQLEQRNVKLVSFAFQVPGRSPMAERGGVYMYQYLSKPHGSLRAAPVSDTISNMKHRASHAAPDQRGEASILLIPFILTVLLFIAAAGFGLWAYSQREDYRLNTEQKVAVAVKDAVQTEDIRKDKEHAEADKSPLRLYAGPDEFGSLRLMFPKTWSGYIEDNNGNEPINGYFNPGVVPSVSSQKSIFALRVEVVGQSYTDVLKQMTNTAKGATASPFAYPKVPKVVGVRFDGVIDGSKQLNGSMVIVPLRDKTLQVSTQSSLYLADFNNSILPNLSFSP